MCYKSQAGQLRMLTPVLPQCLSSEIPLTLTTAPSSQESYMKRCENQLLCECDENDRLVKWSYQCDYCYYESEGQQKAYRTWVTAVSNDGNALGVRCEAHPDHNMGCDGVAATIDITCERP